MTDLRELVQDLIKAGDRTQSEVAISWTEEAARVGLTYKASTVESRLSEFLAGKTKGLRFFLDDPAAGKALATTLVRDPEQRQEFMAAVELGRQDMAEPRTRLVLDVCELVKDREEVDRLFEWLEGVLGNPALQPALLPGSRRHGALPGGLRRKAAAADPLRHGRRRDRPGRALRAAGGGRHRAPLPASDRGHGRVPTPGEQVTQRVEVTRAVVRAARSQAPPESGAGRVRRPARGNPLGRRL